MATVSPETLLRCMYGLPPRCSATAVHVHCGRRAYFWEGGVPYCPEHSTERFARPIRVGDQYNPANIEPSTDATWRYEPYCVLDATDRAALPSASSPDADTAELELESDVVERAIWELAA